MIAITRIYNRNGAYVEDFDFLDFGKISASSYREPQIISLKADKVDSISGIRLKIAFSQSTDVSGGFVEYYTSKDIIQDFSNIKKKTFELDQVISVDNFTADTSEYVYIWVNPQKVTFRGNMVLKFEWDFNYVEVSSSSSSSSSCQYGEFITISPFEDFSISVEDCEIAYLKFVLGYSDYSTLTIDGDVFSVENDGGCMIVNDVVLCGDGDCEEFDINGHSYWFCLMDYVNFVVRVYRDGDCSPFSHLLLTTGNDFVLMAGVRLLLLEDTTVPKDQLLMTDGDTFWFVDGTGFYLLGSSSSSSSSSSSESP